MEIQYTSIHIFLNTAKYYKIVYLSLLCKGHEYSLLSLFKMTVLNYYIDVMTS